MSCGFASAGTSFAATGWPLTINSTLRVAPIGIRPPIGVPSGISPAKATFAFTVTGPALSIFTSPPIVWPLTVNCKRVAVAVADVRAALGQALAPLGVIDLVDLAELHVDAALANAAAGDAREIGLAAGLEREAAVHDVVPAVPFRHARSVHCTDEVADLHRRR